MQGSNSIWKLTALAGVVGLGLLGILQFQRTMDRKTPKTADAKVRLQDFKPQSELDRADSKTDDLDLLQSNAEPRRLDKPNARKLDVLENEGDESPLDELPLKKTRGLGRAMAGVPIDGDRQGGVVGGMNGNPRLPVSYNGSESNDQDEVRYSRVPVLDQDEEEFAPEKSQPAPKKAQRPRVDLSLNDPNESVENVASESPELASNQFASSDQFGDDTKPRVESRSRTRPQPQPQKNVKAQAQQLIQLARKLIDNGLLDEARLKAEEASELAVAYGPLDDTPQAVLAEIERLEGIESLPAPPRRDQKIQLTGGTRDEEAFDLKLDAPSFVEETPKKTASMKKTPKRSPLDDEENLFADNPPATVNGKRRIPDPPVPPAEELTLELPPLPEDGDMPPPAPLKAKHSVDSANGGAPSRLKPQAASPIAGDENFNGDGTVHADAPRGPQRPELKIEKVAPPNATLGQPMVYTIVIRNVGESAANSVVVEDQVPKGTSLSGTIPRAELTGKKLIWRLGTIKPGEQKEISVKVVPVAEGQVGSVATVNFQAEIASRTTVASPKLSMKLTAQPQVRLGETVQLNFQITNNGTVDAHRVVLRNLIPENMKAPDVAERDLEFEVGTLAAGKTQSVQLPLVTTRPGKVSNKAVLSTDGATAAEAQVDINVIGQLIGLTRQGQTNWFVGRPIEFENQLINNSLSATANTVVVESLPGTVEFVSATEGGRFDARQRTVTWHVPHLDPQQSLSLKIRVVPKAIGNHAGSVQVTENGRKGAATDYQFRAIGAAVLHVEFVEKSEAYSKGEQVKVRMQVRNKGSGAASNVAVRMTVPPELQFVSAKAPVSHTTNGREIIFEPISEIGGQGAVAFELNFKAIGSGDSTLQVELQSDQFKKSVTHEEPFVIFGN